MMKDLFKIDIEALAFELGIPFDEGMMPPDMMAAPDDSIPPAPPMPKDKPPKRFQRWDGEILQKVLNHVRTLDIGSGDILLEGQVPSWVIAAIADLFRDRKVYNYVYYLEKALEMPRLPMGKPEPEGKIRFVLTSQGDGIYLQYIADDPECGHDHNYDYSALPNVKVPVVEPGKNIYIAGHGATFVQVSIALAYTDTANSVYVAFHGGNGTSGSKTTYNCAVSNCAGITPGQEHTVILP